MLAPQPLLPDDTGKDCKWIAKVCELILDRSSYALGYFDVVGADSSDTGGKRDGLDTN